MNFPRWTSVGLNLLLGLSRTFSWCCMLQFFLKEYKHYFRLHFNVFHSLFLHKFLTVPTVSKVIVSLSTKYFLSLTPFASHHPLTLLTRAPDLWKRKLSTLLCAGRWEDAIVARNGYRSCNLWECSRASTWIHVLQNRTTANVCLPEFVDSSAVSSLEQV